jgi:hypothetical protein
MRRARSGGARLVDVRSSTLLAGAAFPDGGPAASGLRIRDDIFRRGSAVGRALETELRGLDAAPVD